MKKQIAYNNLQQLKKILLQFAPISLGVFLIWYSLSNLTENEFTALKNIFATTDYRWVFLCGLIGLFSHISRGYRWFFTLEPIGYRPKFLNNFMAVMSGYLINLGIPRAGELFRASALHRYEKIPLDKSLGTIVAERVADVIVYAICIGIALFFQYDLILQKVLQKVPKNPLLWAIIFSTLFLIVLFLFRFIQKNTHPVCSKIKKIFLGFWEGVQSILKMKKKWTFIGHTLFIWVSYILIVYVIFIGDDATANLSFGAVMVCFVMGTFSFATTNGGIGMYPIVIQQTLLLYNIDPITALGIGWLIWFAQTVMIVLLGLLSLLFLPIYNRENNF